MKTCTVCGAEWSDDTKFCPRDGSTLRSAAGADLVGSVIADRYHIEKKLGEGGMGAVYLGEHVKMGRKSAIKVMAQSMASDPEALARFNREAANAARINHPNVCAIYDFGETADGTIYLAMEFIEGAALSDTLRTEGALPLDRAAHILQQTGDALQAAHDLGIVHRDLKPDNIMVTKGRDGREVVKVVDFGIAKAMTGEEGQKVTKTGLVVGTPEYMSPEQLSGDVLDGRSDVYSLALVFFRMVTGALPFQADSAQETMIKRLTDQPLKLSEVVPDAQWPPRLQGVMDRALQRMPADRYDSAALFAGDVADAVRGAAVAASADTEGATQLIDTGVTDQLIETRVSAGPEPTTPPTPAPMPSPEAPPAKKKPVVAIAASIAAIAIAGGSIAVVTQSGGGEQSPGVQETAGGAGVVSPDTAQRLVQRDPGTPTEAGQPGAAQRESVQTPVTQPGTRRTERPAEEPSPPPLDTAALRESIRNYGRLISDPATRASGRQELERLYGDQGLPAVLRARAASYIAESYDEDNDDRPLEACRWIANAIALDPGNDAYRQYKDSFLGCPS